MKTMRKRAAALFLAACVCTMLAGCGRNNGNAATENMTTAGETNANGATTGNTNDGNDSASRNNTVTGTATSNTANTDRNAANGTVDNVNRTTDENGMVNSATAGRDDNYDGNRESGLAEIGEGVGDVGRGIIDGAENVVDDLTGNGPAERNNETNNNR